MALVVGQNSWVTVAEADSYFTDKPGTENWFSLNPTPLNPGEGSKESYLITAYYWLLDDTFGLAPGLTNDSVKRAQMESALFLLNYSKGYNEREALIASGVKEFEMSKWDEVLSTVNKPQRILNLLTNAGYGSGNQFVDLSEGL